MEGGNEFRLQTQCQINHEVAATDEVHAREGGLADEILSGEDDLLAQRLAHPITPRLFNEESSQPFWRDVGHKGLRVQALPGFVEQRVVQVGREDLNLGRTRGVFRKLGERHRDGIRFLSRRTAQRPDAQRVVARAHRQESGEDGLLECLESLWIAEEGGHADEHVRVQRVQFPHIALQ